MGYKLHYSKSIITRAANTTAYNTFSLLSDASNLPPAIPMRFDKSKLVYLVSIGVMFNWALAPASSSVRVYLTSENPGSITDQASNTSFNLSPIYDSFLGKYFFNTVNDGAGNQYGYLNVSPPLAITSSTSSLYAVVELANGITNTVSSGQIKFIAGFEEPF